MEEAVAYYRQHWEPAFSKARILIADHPSSFQNATLLQHYILDDRGRIALIQSEDIELNTDAHR